MYTEVYALCDKLVVDRGKYCQLSSTNDGPVYHTEGNRVQSVDCWGWDLS